MMPADSRMPRKVAGPQPADSHQPNGYTGVGYLTQVNLSRKQRVTITLPASLIERLRNAVYWTGHGTLARLISDSLDDVVSQMEQANGGAFPIRLTPLKRGRPRHTPTLLGLESQH